MSGPTWVPNVPEGSHSLFRPTRGWPLHSGEPKFLRAITWYQITQSRSCVFFFFSFSQGMPKSAHSLQMLIIPITSVKGEGCALRVKYQCYTQSTAETCAQHGMRGWSVLCYRPSYQLCNIVDKCLCVAGQTLRPWGLPGICPLSKQINPIVA